MKAIRLFIVQDDSLFCEGITGLIREEKSLEIVGAGRDVGRLKRGFFREPDVVIICSAPFSPEELPKIVQEITKKVRSSKILLVLKEDVSDEALMHFLMSGVDGYLRRSATSKQLINAIEAVHTEGVWAERGLLNKFIRAPLLRLNVEARLTKIKTPLTKREKEIVSLLFLGLSNRAMGDRLCISEKTVKTHFNSIFRKLRVNNRAQIMALLIHSN